MRLVSWLIALSLASLVLACTPDPAEEALKKATAAFKKSDFGDAGPLFEEALRLNPKLDPKNWDKAAFSYKSSGNYIKTAEILLKQAEGKPVAERVVLLRNIANMFLTEAKDLDNAEHYFLEALKLDPKDDASLSWLGEISSYRGGARNPKESAKPADLDIAIQRYDQLIALTPKAPIPYVNKRIVLFKYIKYWQAQKAQAEKDAEDNKADKAAAQEFLDKAKEDQAKVDALTVQADELGKVVAELNKAAKEAKDAAKDAGK